MGKMELILIRHGETDWNKDGVFRGQMDVKLNAMGIAQADLTAGALASKVFEAMYTSPLKRALVTARRIAKPHEMVERIDNGLMDMNFGRFQGLTESEVASRYPRQLKVWKENPGKARFPGGETSKKAWKRVNSSLREILVVHGYGTVVIVSHRVPVKMMTAYLLGKDRNSIGEIRHDHCAISAFEIDGRDYKPIVLNDSSHLSKLGVLDKKDF
jgi:broad specificity phosphatase PhoE